MDPLVGAAVAGAAGAVSIVAAAFLPVRLLDTRVLRLSGAASIALMGLVALGAPVPAPASLAVLLGGFLVAFLVPILRSQRPDGAAGPAGVADVAETAGAAAQKP